MTLEINQDFEYQGEDSWKWWVWMEGSEEELNEIDSVIYTLHVTFPNPVRTITDRASKFRLETSGWGEFRLFAKVMKKDGESLNLQHDLVLKYPDGRPSQ